jgi:hypothetical protein
MATVRLEISIPDAGASNVSRVAELLEIQRIITGAVELLKASAGRQYHTLTDGDGNNIGSIFYQTSDFREADNEKA